MGNHMNHIDKIKIDLINKIIKARNKNDTQQILAKKLKVTQPRLSNLFQFKIEKFSIDCLVEFLVLLDLEVKIEVQ